jgi:hypothetical protein
LGGDGGYEVFQLNACILAIHLPNTCMAKFLNTSGLNEWIPKLISETVRELVIVMPYIKCSATVFEALSQANNKRVETTLVYREDKLSAPEKSKLMRLDNLNLMHHPNIHCKCYYNENYLLITSMNMHEYSESNNREMGVLFSKSDYQDNIFTEAVEEIRQIVQGATFEKKSRETIDDKFEVDIIKTEREKLAAKCEVLNRYFDHKTFEPIKEGHTCHAMCVNYFDRMDIVVAPRSFIYLRYDENRLQKIFDKFTSINQEFSVKGCKIYWNYHLSPISVYKDMKQPIWTAKEADDYDVWKELLHKVIGHLRNYI